MQNQNTNENLDILNFLENEFNNDSTVETLENNDIFSSVETIVVDDFSIKAWELKSLFNQKILNALISNEIIETKVVAQKSFAKKSLEGFIFFVKYILTSSLIFSLLLTVTNYSAYLEIAKNFLSPESLKQSSQAMIASINSTNISKAEADNTQLTSTASILDDKSFHSMEKLVWKNNSDLDINIDIVPYENRVVIPKIGKNIPLVDVENRRVQNVKELEDVFMEELVKGIVRYPGSAKPGEEWNSFIFGHSSNFPWIKWDYNDVFALLDNVVFGDEIIVYNNQKKYIYTVKEKHVVKPGDVAILKRNEWKKEISLMTCWPVWTSVNRMVVIWELTEVK